MPKKEDQWVLTLAYHSTLVMNVMNKNMTKLLNCYRVQCADGSPKPCWLGGRYELEKGINLHGVLLSETGLGESARLVYDAISTQNVKVAACNRILKDRQNETSFVDLVSENAPYNVSLNVDGLTVPRPRVF